MNMDTQNRVLRLFFMCFRSSLSKAKNEMISAPHLLVRYMIAIHFPMNITHSFDLHSSLSE